MRGVRLRHSLRDAAGLDGQINRASVRVIIDQRHAHDQIDRRQRRGQRHALHLDGDPLPVDVILGAVLEVVDHVHVLLRCAIRRVEHKRALDERAGRWRAHQSRLPVGQRRWRQLLAVPEDGVLTVGRAFQGLVVDVRPVRSNEAGVVPGAGSLAGQLGV